MYELEQLPPRLYHVPRPSVDSIGSRVVEVLQYDWPRQRVRIRTEMHLRHHKGYWVPMRNLEVRNI